MKLGNWNVKLDLSWLFPEPAVPRSVPEPEARTLYKSTLNADLQKAIGEEGANPTSQP